MKGIKPNTWPPHKVSRLYEGLKKLTKIKIIENPKPITLSSFCFFSIFLFLAKFNFGIEVMREKQS